MTPHQEFKLREMLDKWFFVDTVVSFKIVSDCDKLTINWTSKNKIKYQISFTKSLNIEDTFERLFLFFSHKPISFFPYELRT